MKSPGLTAERIVGAAAIAFAMFLLLWLIPAQVSSSRGPVNPQLFPKIAAWLILGLGIIQVFARRPTSEKVPLVELVRIATVALVVTVAALAMHWIGYLPAMMLMMAAIVVMMQDRRPKWLIVSVVGVPTVTWALFVQLLGRPLPPLPF
jgi:putative tricarboxylic transport membrane protein